MSLRELWRRLHRPAPAPRTDAPPEVTRERWAAHLATRAEALEIEHLSGGRGLVFELAPDGQITLRRFGGPIYQMGAVVNHHDRTVEQWVVDAPDAALRERLLDALATTCFPHADPSDMPLPGEPRSTITLRLGDEAATMSLLHRTLARHEALRRALGELDTLGYTTTQRPADARVANPEHHLW